MIRCCICRKDLDDGLYSGEDWYPTEEAPIETLPILDSWWLGEFDPYCIDCAVQRDEQIWEATGFALKGLAALAGGLQDAYNEALQKEGPK